jgi:hypothetical protein
LSQKTGLELIDKDREEFSNSVLTLGQLKQISISSRRCKKHTIKEE